MSTTKRAPLDRVRNIGKQGLAIEKRRGKPVRYLESAAALNLGVADRSRIDPRTVTLPAAT